MNWSLLRLPLAELTALIGIVFGAWLIHSTFQPSADTPNVVLLLIGALDILSCFGLLGYQLRGRLRDGQALPRGWVVAGALLIACFLGWIAALLIDSDRILKEEAFHNESLKQLAVIENSLNHLAAALPAENFMVDAAVWKINHDDFARVHDQLRTSIRSKPEWDKELTRIDDDVQEMSKLVNLLVAPNAIELRLKWRADFSHARERAADRAKDLRKDIATAETTLAATYRARWHAIAASALTGVVLVLGCLLFWLLFDRELRRTWKAQTRLAGDEARFRWLIENQSEPIAVLDGSAGILYANPAWKSAFHYELDELRDSNLLELVHPQDRPRVQAALRSNDAQHPIPCRLSADYGVWHDVEIQLQAHEDASTSVIRVRDLRETSDVPILPQPELLNDDELKAAEARVAELEKECDTLRERESKARGEVDHRKWLLNSHSQASSDGLLILSARGEVLSWNQAFARLWKLSDETLSAHTWQTVAAHMESQVASGWDDFQRATSHNLHSDNCWEMTLEGDRTFEVYAQALHDHPSGDGAVQFHFRDVTRNKDLETQLRDHHAQARDWQKRLDDHEEAKRTYETDLREREKRVKQLEKQVRERDHHREELESTLRDHQDRLHQMHDAHENHAATLQASKEATRRLASGVANDFNNVLSVVLGNTDVLRDNLPKDHVAQNYLDDIHNAASKGTELSQRLLAFSRNHLLQMAPIEMNQELASLEPKMRVALGHVQLDWHKAEQELWVKTDPHPLEQALLHVVTHAKQHMPEGGTLTVGSDRVQLSQGELTHADMKPGSYIQVRLTDTGPGIDDEKLPHVFEPYHPVVDGQKGDLSLATAYGILRQSGGCIDVDSEKGKGTIWTILLPETSERPQSAGIKASA